MFQYYNKNNKRKGQSIIEIALYCGLIVVLIFFIAPKISYNVKSALDNMRKNVETQSENGNTLNDEPVNLKHNYIN